MQIQLRIERDGTLRRWCKPEGAVVVGRGPAAASVDVDLSDDPSVSRLHARIWYEHGEFWIEDKNSRSGTWLDDENIKGRGAKCLGFDKPVRIGQTTIQLEKPDPPTKQAAHPNPPTTEDSPPANVGRVAAAAENPEARSDAPIEAPGFTFIERLDTGLSGVIERDARSTALERQLACFVSWRSSSVPSRISAAPYSLRSSKRCKSFQTRSEAPSYLSSAEVDA